MKFREYINESELHLIKGKEYKIDCVDDEDRNQNPPVYGKYIGTFKGRLSPNKGKDVYKFKATKDAEGFIKGEFVVGFWEVKSKITSITEV